MHSAGDSQDASSQNVFGEWNLTSLRQVLWQRRWLAVMITVEVFVLTGLVTYLRTPQYTSTARVLIERSTTNVMNSSDVMPIVWNEFEIQRFYQTQYLLVRDPAILKMALERTPALEKGLIDHMLPPPEERDPSLEIPTRDDLAKYMRERLTVSQLDYSNVISVSFEHPSAQIAADAVNAVLGAYKDFFVSTGIEARNDATTLIETEIQSAQAELRELDVQIADARDKAGLPVSGTGTDISLARLQRVDQALTEAKARRVAAEARVESLRHANKEGVPEVVGNPAVMKYREDMGRLQAEIAKLEGKVGPSWPRRVELERAIAETRRNLEEEQFRLYGQVSEEAHAALASARQEERQLAALLDRELQNSSNVQRSSSDLQQLLARRAQTQASLERLLSRKEEVSLGDEYEKILARQVTVLAKARVPEQPSSPRVKLNLALGLLFGLFLGLGAVFVAEAMDNKVRNGSQLQHLLGLPLLGSIPRVEAPSRPRLAFSRKNKKQAHSPMMAAQQHDAEESFRGLRSALMLSQAKRPPRSILVTSALPGEGKSTIAANLARTLATFGHRTVLIDADLRHPRLHRLFRAEHNKGLTNVLASSECLEKVMLTTHIENLVLIPGGPCPPDPATLLDEERFRVLVSDLTQLHGFEFVIIDTPPLLVFADAFNIVPAVEGSILVGRAMETPKEAIRQAYESLAQVDAPMLGCVLNGEVSEEQGGSYYRYYHYRRGYYQKEAERRNASEGSEVPRRRRKSRAKTRIGA